MSSQTDSIRPEASRPYQEAFSLGRFIRANGTQLGILGVFVALWITFIIAAPGTFLSPQIYLSFMSTIPFFAIMAIPLTILVIAGEMDLSFPSIMAMGMVGFSFVYNTLSPIVDNVTLSVFLAIVAALLTGVLLGWINGMIVVRFGIPSLVATIGTQFLWRGAVMILTEALNESMNYTLKYIRDTIWHPLLVGRVGDYFPMQMFWLIVVALLGWVLLNRHRFGAHIYLIGDNANSAALMGVNTGRTRIQAFMLVGLFSAFAGVIASFYVAYFWPSLGEGHLLTTLASVFLGGTSVFGGAGTILGTFIGAFIIGTVQAATVAVHLTGFWTEFIYGLIIVLSVIMHAYLRKRTQ